ncbi:MAG: exo-alpha-sialidase [Phycisphaerae bacterium]|nr:exo-alpha-sialidase [Phycisphaerae bacterium]
MMEMLYCKDNKPYFGIPGTCITTVFYILCFGGIVPVRAEVSVEVSSSFSYVVTNGGYGGYEAFPDLARLQDCRLMCAFYEGYSHISPPKAGYPTGGRIMYVTSSDEGVSWSTPTVLYDTPEDDRDPSITQLSDGRLLATYFTYNDGGLGSYLIQSNDAGLSWSTPRSLAPAPYFISSPIVEVSTGRLIAPLYYEDDVAGIAHGAVTLSDDGGANWSSPIDIPNPSGVFLDAETNLIERKDGSLWAIQRASHSLAQYSVSTDQGETWSDSESLDFIAHSSYLLRSADSHVILMAYRSYEWPAGTGYTALRYSLDECETWSDPITIDADCIGAYPSMVNLNDGSVLVTYYEEGGGSDIRARIITISGAPEPGTFILFCAGLIGLTRGKRI